MPLHYDIDLSYISLLFLCMIRMTYAIFYQQNPMCMMANCSTFHLYICVMFDSWSFYALLSAIMYDCHVIKLLAKFGYSKFWVLPDIWILTRVVFLPTKNRLLPGQAAKNQFFASCTEPESCRLISLFILMNIADYINDQCLFLLKVLCAR